MQAQVSQPVRYSVLAAVAALAVGLVWLGVVRYQAEQRSVEVAAAPASASVGSQPQQVTPAVTVPAEAAPAPVQVSPKPEPLVVHVAGAVVQPGVYRLEPGKRVADAIEAAGGALPEAMADALNLAAHVADGDKIYVPTSEEAAEQSTTPPAAQGATQTPVVSVSRVAEGAPVRRPAGPVNVNTASTKELEAVTGIGPTTARKIVEYRTQNGPFRSVEELTKVSGIGPKTLEKLRPYLAV